MASESEAKTGSELFQVIERDATLAARVTKEIERLIVESRLSPGDRLLSERELGERFGVSRTVVREAVRALAAKGLLAVRTGDGTYVHDRSQASASEALARLLKLSGAASINRAHSVYEVRRPLEIAIAGMAAERATPDDVARLRGWLQSARGQDVDDARYVEADVGFHLALAAATHNQLFSALMNALSDLMNAIRELGVAVEGSRADGIRQHGRILARVAAHDVDGARQAMSSHMDSSEQILDKVIAKIARKNLAARAEPK